jgi:hypothetical protein
MQVPFAEITHFGEGVPVGAVSQRSGRLMRVVGDGRT